VVWFSCNHRYSTHTEFEYETPYTRPSEKRHTQLLIIGANQAMILGRCENQVSKGPILAVCLSLLWEAVTIFYDGCVLSLTITHWTITVNWSGDSSISHLCSCRRLHVQNQSGCNIYYSLRHLSGFLLWLFIVIHKVPGCLRWIHARSLHKVIRSSLHSCWRYFASFTTSVYHYWLPTCF